MVKRYKYQLSRFLSIFLAFLMFTYNLPLGVFVTAAEGTVKQDTFTLQVVNEEITIQNAVVKVIDENEGLVAESRTDQDGKVSFSEITNAEGTNTFTFQLTLPDTADEKQFQLTVEQGSTKNYRYDIATETVIETVVEEEEETVTDEDEEDTTPFQVTVNQTGSGTVKLNGKKYEDPLEVQQGNNVEIEISPSEGYQIKAVTINETPREIENSKKYVEKLTVSTDTNIEVEFVKTYTITFKSDGNGSIDAENKVIKEKEGKINVEEGSTPSFKVTPNEGYHVEKIMIDGKRQKLSDLLINDNQYEYKFKEVTKNHLVEITFAINTYEINAEAGKNGIVKVEKSKVKHNENSSVHIFPEKSYKVKTLKDNGKTIDLDADPNVILHDDGTYTYNLKNIKDNHDIHVEFEPIPNETGSWQDYVSIEVEKGKLIDASDENIRIYSNAAKVKITPKDPYNKVKKEHRWANELILNENQRIEGLQLRHGKEITNVFFEEDVIILFDTQAPEIGKLEITGDGEVTVGEQKWFSGNVTVSGKIKNKADTFEEIKYSTEVEKVYYSKGEGDAEEAEFDAVKQTFDLIIPEEDYNDVYHIWAVDKAGNASEVKRIPVHVDKTKPTLIQGEAVTFEQINDDEWSKWLNFLTFGTFFNKEIEVTVRTEDSGSGVKSIELIPNEAEEIPEIDQIDFTTNGKNATATFIIRAESFTGSLSVVVTDHTKNTETYLVTDENSNMEDNESGIIMIDKELPTASIEVTSTEDDPLEGDTFNHDVNFHVSVGDVDSGLNRVIFLVNDEIYQEFTYTSERTFEDSYVFSTKDIHVKNGKYKFTVLVIDHAGNTETAEETVYIDKTSPRIKGFYLETQDDEPVVIADEKIREEYVELTDYGYYFKKPVRVTIVAADKDTYGEHVSGVQSMVVYLKDHKGKHYGLLEDGSLEEITEEDIKNIVPIQTDREVTFDMPKNFKGQIIAKATDQVNNTGAFESAQGTIVESPEQHEKEEHIVFEKEAAPAKDNHGRDLYSENVDVDLTVIDTYSGIEKIEWSVEAPFDQGNNQSGSLILNNDGSYAKGSDTEGWEHITIDHNLVTEMKKKITVKNNSNDIVVKVKMTDRAGNTSEDQIHLSIDKTAPTIDITYDNNDADPEYDSIYNEERIATITITERNFNPEDVIYEITNSDSDVVPTMSEWTTVEGEHPDETTHTATIHYTMDGDYTFDISYADLAKNQADAVEQHIFTIDLTAPELEVTYDNNDAANGYYYKEQRTATITVKEHNFDENRVQITGATVIGKEQLALPELSEWEEVAEDVHEATMTFTEDAFYHYDIEVADKAGNTLVEDFEKEEFIVDQTPATLAKGEAVTFKQKNDNYFARVLNFLTFGTFFNKEVSIEVKTIDGTSGIEAIELLSSEGKAIPQKRIKINEDELTGEATFRLDVDKFDAAFDVKVTDVAHNVETYAVTSENSNIVSKNNRNVIIEKKKPEIEISVIPKANVSSYKNQYNGDVTYEIIVKDKDSGVNTVIIDVNGKKYEYDYSKRAEITKNPEPYRISTDDKGIHINEDGSYHVSVYVVDNAGNEQTDSITTYKDETSPVILDYTFSSKGSKTYTDDLSKSAKLTNYGYYFKEQTKVKISAEDPKVKNEFTSGLKAITVYLKDHDNGKYYAVLKNGSLKEIKESQIGRITPITTKRDVTFTVPRAFKGQIFAQATDYVQNTGAYVTPDGTIVESPAKHNEETHITIDKPTAPAKDNNGVDLYAGNVNVDVTVTDTYSGISEIEWSVIAPFDTENNQSGSLKINNDRTYAEGSNSSGWKQTKTDRNLVTEMKKTITVSNDSNDIKVRVKMTDRAGNTSEEDVTFSIDKTAPTIDISFDNNMPDPENTDYYNESRTATIVITERNFKPEDVEYRITNTDGTIPSLSGWSTSRNSRNPNLTTHTATIHFSADGDYTLDIAYEDNAGNKAAPVDQEAFTIDQTKPIVQVSYDANDPTNGNYYNTARTATITVTEHNFDPSRIRIQGTATDDGKPIAFPALSGWSSNGDVHTATISYSQDGLYSFDIDYMDMAGNQAEDFEPQEFYVDQTEPEIVISGVEDMSANNGKVAPVIEFSDTNFDRKGISVELRGANRGKVQPDGAFSDKGKAQVFTFKDFEEIKENDDLYTLTATIVDYAGNETTEQIRFSVNRFGSVYAFDESLDEIIGKYVQEERDIIITETNVNRLKKDSIDLKMTYNGTPTDLEEGIHYTIKDTGGAGSWSQYTYTIKKELFAGDGRYTVSVYSEDAAGNINENIDEAKEAEISFGIDKTAPVVVPIDIEENTQYPVDTKTTTISVKDNLVLDQVTITLNDEEIEYVADGENYMFEIPSSNAPQNVKVLAMDAAGNEVLTEIDGFLVTTNLLARWYNNKPLFTGSLTGVAVLAAAVLGYFLLRNRKGATDEDAEEKVS